MLPSRDPGSFRDPAGFVFRRDGVVYRQVNAGHGEGYRHFLRSGLYDELAGEALVVAHEEVPLRLPEAPPALAVLRPDPVPFISYPYEWCFSQLKAAALLTLALQRRALARDMTLRDASAYNVQFVGRRPVFIDTLSFGPHVEGTPWQAYRQFCQHFLAPLALMALAHDSLGRLSRVHLDGVPLDVATHLLPLTSRARPGLLLHLHLHARAVRRAAGGPRPATRPHARMGRRAMLGLVDSLERTVQSLTYRIPETLWSTYAAHRTYAPEAVAHKRRLVREMIAESLAGARSGVVWDLGANTGEFSRIAAESGALVVAFDDDHASVEAHVRHAAGECAGRTLPLVQNLANPSPPAGWNVQERRSLIERGPADLVLALALVHHLAIGNQVPLDDVAAFFAGVSRRLLIEFVPREDAQVQRMTALCERAFDGYTQAEFERAFATRFHLRRSARIPGTMRTLYAMDRLA